MPSFLEKLDDSLARYLAYSNYKNYVSQINLNGKEKVLEVGCGGGNLSRFLAEKLPFGELVCIDNSNYWIDKAGRRLRNFKNIELVREEVLDFERKNYFDVIAVHYVLHDIFEKEKVVRILKDNLNEGGKVYLREPTRKSHGMAFEEIEELMNGEGFLKEKSKEGYSFPIRGRVYEGVFGKKI